MKRLVVGVLAHVDSGKTTLSEALLYRAGSIRKLGRVDHRDAFLDTDALEKARGITIFAKQAVLTLPAGTVTGTPLEETQITLLDTPGHVDFSAEAERTLQVLDYAVLVISGTDGIQSHTMTLWRLLERYHVPTFIYVNKMDLPGADKALRLRELRGRFGDGCVDFTPTVPAEERAEALGVCSEPLMEAVLATGTVPQADLITAITRRQVFPCYFGAALRLDGIDDLLNGLQRDTRMPPDAGSFGARIFKIGADESGARMTYLKVTDGVLKVKSNLVSRPDARVEFEEKADQLRVYSGSKYRLISEAPAGTVCAVLGPTKTYPGQGLGVQPDARQPMLEPVLNYRMELAFGEGGILHKETICAPVEGVGHYEPLRHYAEVHLLLEPGEPGSGLQFASICRTDALDLNWQRLILTHLAERSHPGVLAGAPLTDVKITLTAGRAHIKHTEGGDFRQATYRAVRQGLRTAAARGQAVLLEPWYDFRLEVPQDCVGRAMADLQRRCAEFSTPENEDGLAVITGKAPVAEMRGCAREVTAYTHGAGRLSCMPRGYAPCHNTEAVLEAVGYQPDADTENPADSVFCSHGAGYLVKWDEVPAHAHVASGLGRNAPGAQQAKQEEADASDEASDARRRAAAYCGTLEQDKELLAIFERTYGPIKRRGEAAGQHDQLAARKAFRSVGPSQNRTPAAPPPSGPEYLLVDGYNVIFAWDELKKIAAENLDAARRRLMDILCNYAGYRKCVPILVFDAYRVKGAGREQETWHNLHVIYTREAETADMFIERATHELAKNHRVRVVSSDGAEQIIILGNGALRVSARAFEREVRAVEAEIREFLDQ